MKKRSYQAFPPIIIDSGIPIPKNSKYAFMLLMKPGESFAIPKECRERFAQGIAKLRKGNPKFKVAVRIVSNTQVRILRV